MHFKVLEIRNLKSFGDTTQRIVFDDLSGVTLIMGQNNDVVDTNSRNGCGKSTILDALCLVLTNQPLKKNKKREGLLNRKHGKNLVVTLLFEHNYRGRLYEGLITRGISPNFCRFYAKPKDEPGDLQAQAFDRTRDSMDQTTKEIIAFTGMDSNVFRQVMLVAAKQPSVLELENKAQKSLCETIFGFEILSEKAEAIKKQRNLLENQLNIEKTRIDERRIAREQQVQQIARLEQAHTTYETDRAKKISDIKALLEAYEQIDFEAEGSRWALHVEKVKAVETVKASLASVKSDIDRVNRSKNTMINDLGTSRQRLAKLQSADPEAFILACDKHTAALETIQRYKSELATVNKDLTALRATRDRLKSETEQHTDDCPTCQQPWPDHDARAKHMEWLKEQIAETEAQMGPLSLEAEKLNLGIGEESLIKLPTSDVFSNRDAAVSAGATIQEIEQNNARMIDQIEKFDQEKAQYEGKQHECEQHASTYQSEVAATLEGNVFDSFAEFLEGRRTLESLSGSLTTTVDVENPHSKTLQDAKAHLPDEVDEAILVNLKKQIDHRKYLEKRLTNQNSDIRRGVMQVWLPKLNEEVYNNLEAMDLPYRLLFNDDFTVSTIDTSEETDFALVSSGEEERAIIAVSLALRKVYEGLHGPINLFCVDERLDSGLDEPGAERAMSVLKEYAITHHKSIFLISHKKEMMDFADRVMLVVKEGKESRISIGGKIMDKVGENA